MQFGHSHRAHILLNLITKPDGKPYTIMEVAQGVDMKKSNVYNLFSGELANPSFDMLHKVATFFGVDTNYFTCSNTEECIAFLAHTKKTDTEYKNLIRARIVHHDQEVREALQEVREVFDELLMLVQMKSALNDFSNNIDPDLVGDPSILG